MMDLKTSIRCGLVWLCLMLFLVDGGSLLRAQDQSQQPERQRLESQQLEKTLKTLACLLYTSPSPRDATLSRMPSSA